MALWRTQLGEWMEMMNEEIINLLFEQHKAPGVKWRAFANPMRRGSYFVAEDIPIKPYDGVCGLGFTPIYPTVPATRHCVEGSMPREVADALVERLNLVTAPR